MKKSVKSLNPCKSVIQTSFDIVKAHGGKITLDTKEEKGTTFQITLPITTQNNNA
jgi:signal transduction histidine kinase